MDEDNMAEKKMQHARARTAFDTISQAAYYGFAMRELLAGDPEALEAAEKLAEVCRQKLKQAFK